MGRRKRILAIVCAAMVLGIALAGVLFRRDLLAWYHRSAKEHALRMAYKVDSSSFRQGDYVESYERHLEALVQLGAVERREFRLTHISVPSLEARRLWEELMVTFPGHQDAQMQGYEDVSPDMITVWERAEETARWAEIVGAHDQPPAGPPGEASLDAPALRPWAGEWQDQEGNVLLSLVQEADGRLTLRLASTEPWEIIIKNVHVDGLRLTFDQYRTMEPREELKSASNRSGDHPFSGVRCCISIVAATAKPDALDYTVRTPVTGQTESHTLARGKQDATGVEAGEQG
jgi:hypothetical protein